MSRTLTPRWWLVVVAGFLCLLPLGACSGKQDSGQLAQGDAQKSEEPAPAEAGPAEAVEPVGEPAAPPETAAETPGPSAPALTPAPKAKTETPPAPPAPSASPGAETPAPSKAPPEAAPPPPPPAGIVAVPATKPGLSRVGPEKCKLCHKLQYNSWVASAHAARKPPLECESCHGNGSEYATLSIMKDIEKARAAGLVIPEESFCRTCHTTKWQDDMLQRVHAHKPSAPQD